RWLHLNQIMREERISIMAVQETHLTMECKAQIEKIFPKLKVRISEDVNSPTSRAGIAIVLNRRLTNWNSVKSREVVPGRALMIQIEWHRDQKLTVMCIYAPNVTEHQGSENAAFWHDIEEFVQGHPGMKPDVILGDFNMVEEPIDRLLGSCQ
ncbi:hypothetical protein IW261DRAFT_1345799, partial [Armillaria novae-zelandiae]